jgi:hypothetical protein
MVTSTQEIKFSGLLELSDTLAHLFKWEPEKEISNWFNIKSTIMIAPLGNIALEKLKTGSVLTVTNVETAHEAHQEIADFLMTNKRSDLGYFQISENYFIVYSKTGLTANAVA